MKKLNLTLALLASIVSFAQVSHAEDSDVTTDVKLKTETSANPVVSSTDSDEISANLKKAADENNSEEDPGAEEDSE